MVGNATDADFSDVVNKLTVYPVIKTTSFWKNLLTSHKMKNMKNIISVLVIVFLASMTYAKVNKKKNKKVEKTVETVVAADSTNTYVAKDSIHADSILIEINKDKTDTIYYDKSWRVIGNKTFATYYRLALYPADSLAPKYFRTYFLNGNIQSEGNFIKLGEKTDATSVFDGQVDYYYNNGSLQRRMFFSNGKPNGELTDYYENGNIKEHIIMRDGCRNGIHTSFSEDGIVCRMQEYTDSQPANFYIVVDKDGNYSKYDASSSTPMLETPDISECQTEYKNGAAWPYYNKNGLIIGVSNSNIKDNIGKYREISVFLVNKSMINVDIDPMQIEVYSMKNGKRSNFEIMGADEYDKKVYKKQVKNQKRSLKKKVVVDIERENNVSENLGASVFDAGTSHTLKSFQENIIKRTSLISGNRMKYTEREHDDLGYLERTTVHPGEMVAGFLFTDNKKVDDLYVKVTVSGIEYLYEWKDNNNK